MTTDATPLPRDADVTEAQQPAVPPPGDDLSGLSGSAGRAFRALAVSRRAATLGPSGGHRLRRLPAHPRGGRRQRAAGPGGPARGGRPGARPGRHRHRGRSALLHRDARPSSRRPRRGRPSHPGHLGPHPHRLLAPGRPVAAAAPPQGHARGLRGGRRPDGHRRARPAVEGPHGVGLRHRGQWRLLGVHRDDRAGTALRRDRGHHPGRVPRQRGPRAGHRDMGPRHPLPRRTGLRHQLRWLAIEALRASRSPRCSASP